MKISDVFNSKQIRVAVAGSLGIKFLSALFAFLNALLLARYLSVQDFGTYVLAFTTITVLSVPVSFGLPNMMVRYVSKYQVAKNFGAIKGLLGRSNFLVLLTITFTMIVAYVLYAVWWNQYDRVVVETFWYGFILLPLIVFSSLHSSVLMGLKYMVLGQLPESFIRNALLLVGIIAMVLFGQNLTPQWAMLIHIFAAAIALIAGYVFLQAKLLRKLRQIPPEFHNKQWLKAATPFGITSGVQIVKARLIHYVLVYFGSLEAVAVFDVALRGANLVAFTLDALNKAISPYLSTAFELNNHETLQRIVTKTTRIVFVFALPVAMIFMMGGESLLDFLFGKEYISAYIPLLILCVGQLINAATGSAGTLLNMTGHQRYFSANQVQMMILMALISVPLVLYLDVIGASLAFGLMLVVQNVLLVLYIHSRLKINTTLFKWK
ncbi:MAG: oligosaccharide flippase family protein [Bacteroidota bacterium]